MRLPRAALAWFALLALGALSAGACGRSADESPVETVRHFLEVMDRSADEEGTLREAYSLVDASARSALTERAERASSLAGRTYEPWQMLARGRFQLRFGRGARAGMRERVDGNRAVVTVSGDRTGQRADVPLVREQGRWRIQLAVPPLRHEGDGARQGDG
jgi:hypothetical protein